MREWLAKLGRRWGMDRSLPYLVTVVVVLGVGLVKILINKSLGINSPLMLFFSAVTFAAWYGGFRQGMLATVLSVFFADRFIHINDGLFANTPASGILFVVDCFLISLICAGVKRAEEKYRYSNAKFLNSIIENIPNMIFIKDAKNLRFVRFNKAGEKLLGYSRETLIGKNDYDFFPKEQAEAFTANDRKVLDNCEVIEVMDEPISTREGMRYLYTRKIPILGEDGQPEYLLGISEDITDKKEAEKQRLDLMLEQAANRAKTVFLANMSHEMRTPLSAILGFSELLIDATDLTPKQSQFAKTIHNSGKQLLKIVDELLDIAKIESDRITVEKSAFCLNDLLNETAALLRLQAAERNIQLKVENHVPQNHEITTDPTRLRQILLNVIGNAIKFTPKGSVEVVVTGEPILKEDNAGEMHERLRFVIKDTGIGIPQERIGRLFKPFGQADDSTNRRFGGTGLGLYLSRKLARFLGGDLELTFSEPGKGTTFTLILDVAYEVRASGGTEKDHQVPTNEPRKFRSVRVLVVDDTETNRDWLRNIAEVMGFTVDTAENANQGLEMALTHPYDIILMDIQMPELDGFEALNIFRKRGYKNKIIAVTAHAMKGDREHCLRAGFDDYLGKPLTRQALEQCLALHAPPVMP